MTRPLDRRRFLSAAGAALALPLLDARLKAAPRLRPAAPGRARFKRLVVIGNPFGMHPPSFYPREVGEGYELTPLLEPLARHRGRFTVLSGLDHGVSGGHAGARAFLSGVRPSHASSRPERNVTIDQKAAEAFGAVTRYPVLNLGVGGTWEMSWTRDGVRVPPITDPRKVFDLLFVPDEEAVAARRARELERKDSVLDAVRERAQRFEERLGAADREKFEEYLAAVRDVERRLVSARAWLDEPKPCVAMTRPSKGTDVEDLPVMLELIALALETDSTRVATLEVNGNGFGVALRLSGSYHLHSHHGMRPELIEGLLAIERLQMVELARFLDRLERTEDPANRGTLLDHTLVLFGSGLGNGNSHSCSQLPILVAGGPLRHGRHLAFPTEPQRAVPLCNLYVTLLQELGLEIERFGPSTGSLAELRA